MALFLFIPFNVQGGGGGSAAPLLTPLDIYVAPAPTGDDANNGLTPETAVLTMVGAFSKIPTNNLGAAVRIHIAEFSELEIQPVPSFLAYNQLGEIIIIGDGAGQAGQDGFTEILSSTAAGVNTSASIVDFNLGTDDVAVGVTIEFLDGPAAGQRRKIQSNTAAGIVPCARFNPAPILGNHFRVISPATVFDASAIDRQLAMPGSANVTLCNVAYAGSGAPNSVYVDGSLNLKMYGVLFSNGASLSIDNAEVWTGLTPSTIEVPLEGVASTAAAIAASPVPFGALTNWTGWGLGVQGSIDILDRPWNAFTGYVASHGSLLITHAKKSDYDLTFLGGSFLEGVFLSGPGDVRFLDNALSIPFLCRADGTTSSFALDMLNGGNLQVVGGANILNLDTTLVTELFTQGGLRMSNGCVGMWHNGPGNSFQSCTGFDIRGSTLKVNLDVDMNYNITNGAIAFYAKDGGTIKFESLNEIPPTLRFISNSGGTPLIATADSTILAANLQGFVPIDIVGTGNMQPISVSFGSRIELGDCQFAGVLILFNALLQGTIKAGSVSDVSALPSGFGVFASGQCDIMLDSFSSSNFVNVAVSCSGQSKVLIQDSELTVADSEVIVCTFQSQVTCSGILNHTVGGILALGGSVLFSGDIVGDGPAITANTLAAVSITDGNLTSNVDTCIICNTGASIANRPTSLTITAALDGVDCTGGGAAFFNSTPTFACGGFELVVGPTAPEQSSFAAALPNPGDAFSNSGAGSRMSRI